MQRRSGNTSVEKLITEIKQDVYILEEGVITKRAQRQLTDAAKFLEMIQRPPYNTTKTVGKLKESICDERNKLKTRLERIDTFIPGHQFSMFETPKDVTRDDQQEKVNEKARIENELKWLHKCLGMCVNKEYFKS